jgi:hypothetical protein
MEPFFIFCVVLVLYCSYLTLIDLLNGHETAKAPASAKSGVAGQAGKTFQIRRRELPRQGQGKGTVGRFATLTQGTT